MPTLSNGSRIYVQAPTAPQVHLQPPVGSGVFVVASPGPAGPAGPPGPAGSVGYVYTQGSPAATWTINTGLGRNPFSVMVLDATGAEIQPDVILPSANQIVVTFAAPATGSVSYT